jgi:hypothetical protein
MCVDYTGLNKACPKDTFPLPRIDQVVDSSAGCETLCFLDAYSGYHQIAMDSDDQHDIYHSFQLILLLFHAVRVEECWRHLSEVYVACLQ